MRCLERPIGRRLHLVLQAQQNMQEPQRGGGLVGNADVRPSEGGDGPGRVQEATASVLHAGDAKPCHRLKAVFQAQTLHQWHWPGVDLAVCRRDGNGARHELVSTPCHGVPYQSKKAQHGDKGHALCAAPYTPTICRDMIGTVHPIHASCNFLLPFVDALVYTAETTGVKSMHRRLCDARSP